MTPNTGRWSPEPKCHPHWLTSSQWHPAAIVAIVAGVSVYWSSARVASGVASTTTARCVARFTTTPCSRSGRCQHALQRFGLRRFRKCCTPRRGCAKACPEIIGISPTAAVRLSEDLTVHYRLSPAIRPDRVELRVHNRYGQCVYRRSDLETSSGSHSAIWPGCKWQGPPDGKVYANPKNGPYAIRVVVWAGRRAYYSQARLIETQLVIWFNMEDPKPSPDEISSGVFVPEVPTNERIGLKSTTGGVIIWGHEPPTFSNIVLKDLDNDGRVNDVESVSIRQHMLPTVPNGVYNVITRGLRDVAGNEGLAGCEDGVCRDWTITLQ